MIKVFNYLFFAFTELLGMLVTARFLHRTLLPTIRGKTRVSVYPQVEGLFSKHKYFLSK